MEYKINSCTYDIKEFISKIIKEFNIDYWDEWLEEQDYNSLSIKPNILVSCEENNKLIGTCSIKVNPDNTSYLNSFYVLKEYRNKGIGSKLYDICEKYVVDNNYNRINLIVDSNPNFNEAVKFYTKRNFILDKYDEDRKELSYHKDI